MWRQKTRKILSGQIGEQHITGEVLIDHNNLTPLSRFIKEEADAASKAKPNKVEKEKLETEKAAPSKVSGDLLSIPINTAFR